MLAVVEDHEHVAAAEVGGKGAGGVLARLLPEPEGSQDVLGATDGPSEARRFAQLHRAARGRALRR